MRCTVLLFAHLADALDRAEIEIDLPDGATALDAVDAALAGRDDLAGLRDRIAVAVNERYVNRDAMLDDGDVVALIPPVSGG